MDDWLGAAKAFARSGRHDESAQAALLSVAGGGGGLDLLAQAAPPTVEGFVAREIPLQGKPEDVPLVAWSADGGRVFACVASGNEQTLLEVDLASGRTRKLITLPHRVTAVTASLDGARLALAFGSSLATFDLERGVFAASQGEVPAGVRKLALRGDLIVAAWPDDFSAQLAVRAYRVENGEPRVTKPVWSKETAGFPSMGPSELIGLSPLGEVGLIVDGFLETYVPPSADPRTRDRLEQPPHWTSYVLVGALRTATIDNFNLVRSQGPTLEGPHHDRRVVSDFVMSPGGDLLARRHWNQRPTSEVWDGTTALELVDLRREVPQPSRGPKAAVFTIDVRALIRPPVWSLSSRRIAAGTRDGSLMIFEAKE